MKEYYRRNLPHFHPLNAIVFITFRLHGSIPDYILAKLKEEYDLEIERLHSLSGTEKEKDNRFESFRWYFEQFDAFLENQQSNNQWLSDNRIAQVVSDAIHYRTGKDYDLIAFTIMPNHVHMIVEIGDSIGIKNDSQDESNTRLSVILHSLKRYTASK